MRKAQTFDLGGGPCPGVWLCAHAAALMTHDRTTSAHWPAGRSNGSCCPRPSPDTALKQSRFVLEGPRGRPVAMRRNIELTHGLVMSEV
jgi:hypothetical protein